MQEWGMPGERAMIGAAVERLRAGGVVAFPTETVYGLGADALNHAAVWRVFELKGRPSVNPLIVHVTGPEMAGRVSVFPARAEKLTRALWPGPVSVVVPRRDSVPGLVTAGAATVAVRCPSHPLTLALLFEFDGPLVGPSANRSGGVSPTKAEHVRGEWAEEEVLVLDGGACRGGIESTVVWLADEGPARILRPGLIGASEIERVLGEPVQRAATGGSESGATTAGGAMLAPGMMERHYAPNAKAVVVEGAAIAGVVRDAMNAGRVVVVGVRGGAAGGAGGPGVIVIELPPDAEGYAAGLYDSLRRADAERPGLIVIERPAGMDAAGGKDAELWAAIADRLRRASA